MPLPNYRIQIVKSIGAQQWSNDYLVVATDLITAEGYGVTLMAMERGLHGNIVNFDYIRTSTTLKGDRSFNHNPINLLGQQDFGAGEYLPLFNTVRVDFGTGSADPARKYYRCPILESWQANGVLTPGTVAMLTTQAQTILPGGSNPIPLVTTKGNLVVNASVHAQVQMRQLTRRGKKKVVVP